VAIYLDGGDVVAGTENLNSCPHPIKLEERERLLLPGAHGGACRTKSTEFSVQPLNSISSLVRFDLTRRGR